MAAITVLLVVSGLVAPWRQAQPAVPVACEFRVFDAADEISRETRVRIYPSGRRENPVRVEAGRVSLAPGLYDVQAVRERDGRVTGMQWVEHLLIQRYPDEGGHHLEVINFKPQYGALELRTGGQGDYQATAFPAGDRARPVATGLAGAGYLLLVVPAGRYDVRVAGKGANAAEFWMPDIDVPQGRTRLRTIRPPASQSHRPSAIECVGTNR